MSLTDGAIKVLVNAEKAIDDAMRTLRVGERSHHVG